MEREDLINEVKVINKELAKENCHKKVVHELNLELNNIKKQNILLIIHEKATFDMWDQMNICLYVTPSKEKSYYSEVKLFM